MCKEKDWFFCHAEEPFFFERKIEKPIAETERLVET
jgi:hypothetical protein